MKNNILKKLSKKYNTGGITDKPASLAFKVASKAPLFTQGGILGSIGSRVLGPLSLLLGAKSAYGGQPTDDQLNQTRVNIPMPDGNTREEIYYGGNINPMSQQNVNQVNQELSAAMAPNISLQMGGVQPLPGGTVAAIPGTDAVEFSGQTHDEGGIMVDQQTEVEDGETMDQVIMKNGGNRDYFFSDHLKKGGMSYAQHHKNILQNGGGQEEVNMLAKMQEKAANRDPKQVAKLGGVMKYDQGGVLGETFDEYVARMQSDRRDNEIINEDQFNINMAKLQKKEDTEQQKLLDKLRNQVMNPGMPLESKIGLGAQFIPTIGAMLTKQKDPEEFTYTPGFTSPIVAGRVKGLKYEAPTQNEARARLASAYTGEQRFLDTSGGGAATMSNRQALFARKLAAEGTLGAQESKDAITAENLTKKSEEQANIRNVENELTAATTNAQLIQKEADRRAAVDNANIQLRNMKENEKISNRMNILNTLAQGVGTVMGDTMQYKADERLARAQGLYGIYERDRLKTLLSGKINPKTGQNYTDQDIALIASGLV